MALEANLERREEFRQRVRARLGHDPDERAWQQLVDLEWVDYWAETYDPATSELRLGEFFEEYRRLAGRPLNGPTEPDLRDRALARIIAAEANRDADVVRFRDEVLGGKPLALDGIEAWVIDRSTRETESLAAFMGKLRRLLRRAGANQWEALELAAPLMLSYASSGDSDPWEHHQRVAPGGTLDSLRLLSRSLANPNRYGLHEALATVFVLTGHVVPVSRLRVSLRGSLVPAFERIVLDVSPRLGPEEVRDAYAKARADLRGSQFRDRTVSPDNLELAIFAAERNDGSASWRELAAEWNALDLGKSYDLETEWKQFAGAARQAYKRVTGTRLEWRRQQRREER